MGFFLGTPYMQEAANRELFTLFTSHKNYLSLLSAHNKQYLGKEILAPLSFDELMSQKIHITSLLKRLFPTLSFSNDSFILFPYYSVLN